MVAVDSESNPLVWTAENSIEELAQLAKSAGAKVVGQAIQKLPAPHKTHYIGKGKIEELIALRNVNTYNVAIFDDELSPVQQQNLEDALKVKVIDRATLILDIFARRARTREGKLQVELAQHQYLLPRLAGQWSHLERLGGGIGTRGPGESQLETDKRLIRNRIVRMKGEIEKVRKHRELYRQKRRKSGIPVIALVGYTNSGKSTLLNTLSRAEVLSKDELFSTLDPTTRRITLTDRRIALITDTVGFIKKLPPAIIAAFRATLEELTDADILVHVVDITSPNASEQCQTVENILSEMELQNKPRITALNKIDLLLDDVNNPNEELVMSYINNLEITRQYNAGENTIFISAHKKWGISGLKFLLAKIIP